MACRRTACSCCPASSRASGPDAPGRTRTSAWSARRRPPACSTATWGPGRYVGVQGMHAAMERAGRFGIGAALVTETTHWGRAHAYACLAADAGFIGLCTTNAIPNMLAPGSSAPALGNNPLAIAAPRGAGRHPVVLDIAMSQAALGRVATAHREGETVPLGWGLDENGHPTSDAAAILASQNLLPMGGHKGAGLALMMELLTAALGGGPLSHEIVQADASGLDAGASKLFVAIDVGAFGDPRAIRCACRQPRGVPARARDGPRRPAARRTRLADTRRVRARRDSRASGRRGRAAAPWASN